MTNWFSVSVRGATTSLALRSPVVKIPKRVVGAPIVAVSIASSVGLEVLRCSYALCCAGRKPRPRFDFLTGRLELIAVVIWGLGKSWSE